MAVGVRGRVLEIRKGNQAVGYGIYGWEAGVFALAVLACTFYDTFFASLDRMSSPFVFYFLVIMLVMALSLGERDVIQCRNTGELNTNHSLFVLDDIVFACFLLQTNLAA